MGSRVSDHLRTARSRRPRSAPARTRTPFAAALPLKESGEELAGFFATAEGEPLYRALGFETRGWVSRRLGGLGDPDALARARAAAGH